MSKETNEDQAEIIEAELAHVTTKTGGTGHPGHGEGQGMGRPREEAGFGKLVMSEVKLTVMFSQTLAMEVGSPNSRETCKFLACGC